MIEAVNATHPLQTEFGRELQRRRQRIGLKQAPAARRVGYSPNTWGMYERGYRIVDGAEIRCKPSFEFVYAVVRMFRAAGNDWDLADALKLAGVPHDPDNLPPLDQVDASDDSATFLELLGTLVPNQRRVLFGLMRTMNDPHTDVENLLKAS